MLRPLTLLMLIAVMVGGQRAAAQGAFVVTGIAPSDGASIMTPGAEAVVATVGLPFGAGEWTIASGAQLMLLGPADVVYVVRGPAKVSLARDELEGYDVLTLSEGGLLISAIEGVSSTLRIRASFAGTAEFAVTAGRTILQVGADGTFVAREVGAADALDVTTAAGPAKVPPGEVLAIMPDGTRETPSVREWQQTRAEASWWGLNVAIASAAVARTALEDRLFVNITNWDRYASAETVVARLRPDQYDPEIRQVAEALATVSGSRTQSGGIQTQPIDAANEVPPLSPAALSVQTIGAGVTAIELNRRASNLLQSTGSRGLGYAGLRNLSVSAFDASGVRSVSPSGLAGSPSVGPGASAEQRVRNTQTTTPRGVGR